VKAGAACWLTPAGRSRDVGGITIERATKPQQFGAWLAHHQQAARRPNKVQLMEAHGFIIEQSEWPPTKVEAAA
jgi:hypothetical protein